MFEDVHSLPGDGETDQSAIQLKQICARVCRSFFSEVEGRIETSVTFAKEHIGLVDLETPITEQVARTRKANLEGKERRRKQGQPESDCAF